MDVRGKAVQIFFILSFSTFMAAGSKSYSDMGDDSENTVDDEPFPCLCHFSVHPVCGEDGVTYPNHCISKCKKVAVAHPGLCSDRRSLLKLASRNSLTKPTFSRKRACNCSFSWDPVCTEIGVTYYNACWANCRGFAFTKGECK